MSGSLNHSPAAIIQQLLVDLGVGTLPTENDDWPISVAMEQDNPDNVITLYDTSGVSDGRSQIDGEQQLHYGFQVRVRSAKTGDVGAYALGFNKAQAIAIILAQSVANTGVTISTSDYIVNAISQIGDVIPLGKDKPTSNLYVFTLNPKVALRQTS